VSSGHYEAVLYRGSFPSTAPVPAESPNPEVLPEPARGPWRVTEEMMIEGPTGERLVKVEKDVYSFSELAAGSAAAIASKKKKGPSARERARKLNAAQAPGISGLKLGMTAEQILAFFPGSKTDAEVRSDLSRKVGKFGESALTIIPAKYSSKAKFAGISQITMTFLDGRVATLYVGYDTPMYEHVDEFVAKFSETSGLPSVDYWETFVGMDTQLKTLKGKDFEVNLFTGGKNVNFNYVQVIDVVAQERLKDRTPELATRKRTAAKS
jgi:hypothetical protein